MEALGINLSSILIYTALFAVIYLLMEKMFLPGLRKNLAARQREISALADARNTVEQARIQAEKDAQREVRLVRTEIEDTREGILDNANKEAHKIISTAEKKASVILSEAKVAQEQIQIRLRNNYADDVRKGVLVLLESVYNQDPKSADPKLVKQALDNLKLSINND